MKTVKLFLIPKLSSIPFAVSINRLKLIFIAFILCLFFPCEAYSFSLKDIKIKSSFGEKFYAEVLVDNDAKKGLKASIGSPQDYVLLRAKRSKVVDELHIIEPIEFVSSDQQLIRIISDKPLFYPSFDLVIKASLEDGTILEKYSLVVDFKKNMSIALAPPLLEEKPFPGKTAETPKLVREKKKIEPSPAPEVKEPEMPKEVVKREAKDKVKMAAKAQETSDGSIGEGTSSEGSITYTVTPGDTLSGILKKTRPQKFNFYKSVVALWRLNQESFLHNNINGLEVGARLSFDNLEDEIAKISNVETARILIEHQNQWKKIRAGISVDTKKELEVSEIPLPGENIIVVDNILVILSGWRQSWENEDIESHFSYYSDNFLSENYSRKNIDLAGWKQYVSGIMQENNNIKIIIKSLHIRKEGNRVVASFLQKLSSDNLISFGTKNITFVKEGEQWKIKEELFRKQNTEILSSNFSFVVRTSSHRDWSLAVKETNRLRKAGFAAYLVKSIGDNKGVLFRVVIGRFRAQMDAYHFAKKLIRGKYIKNISVQKLPYAISLGSLKNEAEAYRVVQKYREKRYSPYLFSIGNEKEVTHHVLVGGYENQKKANNVSKKLSKKEVPHTIIQP